MLGIEDPSVWIAYVLCIASAVLCVVYGAICWNRGNEPTDQQDVQWVEHEQKVEEEL
ncbi:MAG: hypothetical protein J7M21_01485 [Planctomycetes bacterium]|nr:hypothetical protein [Planctomycetota bacterium]